MCLDTRTAEGLGQPSRAKEHHQGAHDESLDPQRWWRHPPLPPQPTLQKVDVSKEDPDQTVERLANFLRIIKYKPNYDA